MRKLGVVLLTFSVVASFSCGSSRAQVTNLTGKWVGTWIVPRSTVGGNAEFNLQQNDTALSGTVAVRDRPVYPFQYEVPVNGKVAGRKISLEWTPPNQARAYLDMDASADGGSMEGTATSGPGTSVFRVRRAQ